MGTKGKRFVYLEEPSDGDSSKINIGYMKELTGADNLTGRNLYGKDMITIKP